LNQKSHNSI